MALNTQEPALADGPRWHYQGSFWRVRRPAFWLFVALVVLSAEAFVGEQGEYRREFPNAWLASLALVALYAVPVALAIYKLDLFEREPRSLMLAALVWGGIVSATLALPLNIAWGGIVAELGGPAPADEWGAALLAPPVEELLKYLGVVVLFLIAWTEFDDVLDGFVYGAIVGLGFALNENVFYFIQFVEGARTGDTIGPVLESFYVRVIASGLYTHVLWTAISGMGFAYAVTQRHLPMNRRVLVAIGAFAVAMLGHFFWNSPILDDVIFAGATSPGDIAWFPWIVYGIVKGLPFLAFLALLVRLAHRREHRWFKHLAEREIGTDAITQEEAAILGDLRARRAARNAAGVRHGKRQSDSSAASRKSRSTWRWSAAASIAMSTRTWSPSASGSERSVPNSPHCRSGPQPDPPHRNRETHCPSWLPTESDCSDKKGGSGLLRKLKRPMQNLTPSRTPNRRTSFVEALEPEARSCTARSR